MTSSTYVVYGANVCSCLHVDWLVGWHACMHRKCHAAHPFLILQEIRSVYRVAQEELFHSRYTALRGVLYSYAAEGGLTGKQMLAVTEVTERCSAIRMSFL